MNRLGRLGACFVIGVAFFCLGAAERKDQPPSIEKLLKPNVFKRLSDDREVMVHASLAGVKPIQTYSFYGVMTVRANLAQTRQVLLDFPLYAEMIPYIERVVHDPKKSEITVEGGIWKFFLRSRARIEEKGERLLNFRIIAGHFTGLTGRLILEQKSEHQTLVYFSGELNGSEWPPRLVIERGAEIVFGFTGRRMRNYIETKNKAGKPTAGKKAGDRNDDNNEIPQPRSGNRLR